MRFWGVYRRGRDGEVESRERVFGGCGLSVGWCW